MKTEIRCSSAPWRRGIEMYARVHTESGFSVLSFPELKESNNPGGIDAPFMVLQMDDAQQLMDELWHCGLRPTEGAGSAGAMAATVRHLEDMRRLVFDTNKPTVDAIA